MSAFLPYAKVYLAVLLACSCGQFSGCQSKFPVLGCSLEIVVDPHFVDVFRHKMESESSTVDSISLHRRIQSVATSMVAHANSIFGMYHFGKRVYRLFIKRLKILSHENCALDGVDYCPLRSSLLDLLKVHSERNKDAFCASYVFTGIKDAGGHVGKAFAAPKIVGGEGGACARFTNLTTPIPYSGDPEDVETDILETATDDSSVHDGFSRNLFAEGSAVSLNTGVVTSAVKNQRGISESQLMQAFAHEVGHTLGALHDFPVQCLFGDDGGPYLMHPWALEGSTASSKRLSSCSIRNISLALHNILYGKRNCFEYVPTSICGNGLVEDWEECDCGENDHDCGPDHCCYPASHPTNPCQLKPEAQCSPSEGSCCDSKCHFLVKGSTCQAATACRESSYCVGTTAICPVGRAKEDGKTCYGHKVCQNGKCEGSICTKFGLDPCLPMATNTSSTGSSCRVHCRKARSAGRSQLRCQPLRLKHQAEGGLWLPANSYCWLADSSSKINAGICTSSATCQPVVTHAKQSTRPQVVVWPIVLVVLVALAALNCFLAWIYCRYCRRTSNRTGNVMFRVSK